MCYLYRSRRWLRGKRVQVQSFLEEIDPFVIVSHSSISAERQKGLSTIFFGTEIDPIATKLRNHSIAQSHIRIELSLLVLSMVERQKGLSIIILTTDRPFCLLSEEFIVSHSSISAVNCLYRSRYPYRRSLTSRYRWGWGNGAVRNSRLIQHHVGEN